jgi:hypothetical protein
MAYQPWPRSRSTRDVTRQPDPKALKHEALHTIWAAADVLQMKAQTCRTAMHCFDEIILRHRMEARSLAETVVVVFRVELALPKTLLYKTLVSTRERLHGVTD